MATTVGPTTPLELVETAYARYPGRSPMPVGGWVDP